MEQPGRSERTEETATGRALVPVGHSERDSMSPLWPRPAAPFLAQLIAADRRIPQARERCRAEPREAVAAYRTFRALGPGRTVCSS